MQLTTKPAGVIKKTYTAVQAHHTSMVVCLDTNLFDVDIRIVANKIQGHLSNVTDNLQATIHGT